MSSFIVIHVRSGKKVNLISLERYETWGSEEKIRGNLNGSDETDSLLQDIEGGTLIDSVVFKFQCCWSQLLYRFPYLSYRGDEMGHRTARTKDVAYGVTTREDSI
ncbi:MAG: hypothetical protein HXS44_00745 [Theionarchaea archaeon]|nr:hypothetical protein [Theionarchaea archaeon]